MQLFVDPSGRRKRPSYAFVLGINRATTYNLHNTRGWQIRRAQASCGLDIFVFRPSPTVRRIRFDMSFSCFGNLGARFAAKTVRYNAGQAMNNPDWTPRRRTLSRTFRF
ncbi:MAG TPA: hypothetical protein VNP20_08465 [Nocardioidaceae bacterium]|nr:hypothetical protein [Nocardioidaceae bacterium]